VLSGVARDSGFTLIELAIVVSVIGIVTAMGLPSLSDVLRDAGVRARAESYSEGLRLARTEAIHRNARVDFVPDSVRWSVRTPNREGGSDLVLHEAASSGSDMHYTAQVNHEVLSFSGSGRASVSNFSASFGYLAERCEADGGDVRCLLVRLSPRGAVRMCDPASVPPSPRACD
jgi:type IV fimbrial biogenesis protein FimT